MSEPYYQRRPGDLLFTPQECAALPVGTIVQHGGDVYTKQENGWATSYGSTGEALTPSVHGETALKAYPHGFEYPHDTVEQYMWKVRDVCLAAGQRHSVSGVAETLERLEATASKFPVGRGMRIIQPGFYNDLRVLPEGSLVSQGDPDRDDFTLFERRPNEWSRVYGPAIHRLHCPTVEEVGGVGVQYDWLETVGDSSSDAAVDQFKVKAWEEGQRAQGNYGWCGVYVQVMRYLGITEQVVRQIKAGVPQTHSTLSPAGERVTAAQAMQYPLGTLFRHERTDGTVVWYQRHSRVTNSAGTRRFVAWHRDGTPHTTVTSHYARMLTVLAVAGDMVPIPAENRWRRIQGLPVGTRFRMNGNHDPYYLNGNNFGVRDDRLRWRTSDYYEHRNDVDMLVVAEEVAGL